MALAYLVTGAAALGLLLLLARAYVSADPRALVRTFRYLVAALLLGIGAVMTLAGRWGIGLATAALGLSALATGRLGPIDLGGGARTRGSGSTVRTAMVEMRLDHDTGDLDGTILVGPQAGRTLDELTDAEVLSLFRDMLAADDAESASLLAAYLDRRLPGWREDFEGDPAAGAGGAPQSGPMTDEEAYEILGLAPGATRAEIVAAHRRLMKRVHPDQGGSTFLAAKINEAKDRLLGGHR